MQNKTRTAWSFCFKTTVAYTTVLTLIILVNFVPGDLRNADSHYLAQDIQLVVITEDSRQKSQLITNNNNLSTTQTTFTFPPVSNILIFQIGFNKVGTDSLYKFFKSNNIGATHFRTKYGMKISCILDIYLIYASYIIKRLKKNNINDISTMGKEIEFGFDMFGSDNNIYISPYHYFGDFGIFATDINFYDCLKQHVNETTTTTIIDVNIYVNESYLLSLIDKCKLICKNPTRAKNNQPSMLASNEKGFQSVLSNSYYFEMIINNANNNYNNNNNNLCKIFILNIRHVLHYLQSKTIWEHGHLLYQHLRVIEFIVDLPKWQRKQEEIIKVHMKHESDPHWTPIGGRRKNSNNNYDTEEDPHMPLNFFGLNRTGYRVNFFSSNAAANMWDIWQQSFHDVNEMKKLWNGYNDTILGNQYLTIQYLTIEWYYYNCKVINYFQLNKEKIDINLIVFDIENDSIEKLIDFLKDLKVDINMNISFDGTKWMHRHTTKHDLENENNKWAVMLYKNLTDIETKYQSLYPNHNERAVIDSVCRKYFAVHDQFNNSNQQQDQFWKTFSWWIPRTWSMLQ